MPPRSRFFDSLQPTRRLAAATSTAVAGGATLSASAPDPAAVRPQAAGATSPIPSFLDQINLVHTALFGWPCDHLTPLGDYLACDNIHQVALKMLDSDRFRWDIRGELGLWPRDKWVMTDYRGLRIWVNLFDGFVSFGVLHGSWENAEVDFMLSCLRPGDGMIDAGANIGVFTLQAARAVGDTGRVYAFEPMRSTFDMLARSVHANGLAARCVLYNEGLGASLSGGSFHRSSHATNPGSSYISADASGGEQIRIRPIDSIDYERPIRFIKIDVEGFEPHIIRGAAQTLRRHAPIILTEFFPRSLREIGGIPGAGYVAMLERLGYAMTVFENGREGEPVTSQDAPRFDAVTEPLNLVCRPVDYS
jgi:FkbM family methyltransferase